MKIKGEFICINNNEFLDDLSNNKKYIGYYHNNTDTDYRSSVVYIIDNSGEYSYYSRYRFLTLEEYREKQLNEILQ